LASFGADQPSAAPSLAIKEAQHSTYNTQKAKPASFFLLHIVLRTKPVALSLGTVYTIISRKRIRHNLKLVMALR